MTPPPRLSTVPIVMNREVVPGRFLLACDAPDLAASTRPGQFVMVSFPGLLDPLLPRPFAVFSAGGKRVEILYRRVGKGTGLLSRLRAGERIRIFGPLGNGFPLETRRGSRTLVIAGGMGIASLHLLLLRLLHARAEGPLLLYGERRTEHLIPLAELEERGLAIELALEDGKIGKQGTVVDLLKAVLEEGRAGTSSTAFVCGPPGMMREVAPRLKEAGIRGYFSLEAHMACGYGLCQGCAVPAGRGGPPGEEALGFKKVCTDGPVFAADEICWEAL